MDGDVFCIKKPLFYVSEFKAGLHYGVRPTSVGLTCDSLWLGTESGGGRFAEDTRTARCEFQPTLHPDPAAQWCSLEPKGNGGEVWPPCGSLVCVSQSPGALARGITGVVSGKTYLWKMFVFQLASPGNQVLSGVYTCPVVTHVWGILILCHCFLITSYVPLTGRIVRLSGDGSLISMPGHSSSQVSRIHSV